MKGQKDAQNNWQIWKSKMKMKMKKRPGIMNTGQLPV